MWPSWNGCMLPHSLRFSLSHPLVLTLSSLNWNLTLSFSLSLPVSPLPPSMCQINPAPPGERRFYFRQAELLVLGWVPRGRSPWQPLTGDNHVFQRMEEQERVEKEQGKYRGSRKERERVKKIMERLTKVNPFVVMFLCEKQVGMKVETDCMHWAQSASSHLSGLSGTLSLFYLCQIPESFRKPKVGYVMISFIVQEAADWSASQLKFSSFL